MGFQDEFEQHQKSQGGGSDFFKFTLGDHAMRILTEPVKKVSRFGHGICYPGAAFCDPAVMDKEYEEKVAKAKEEGKDPKKVNRPNLGVKWSVWAVIRATGDLAIVDLTNSVAEKLLTFMASDEYKFSEFPMPYDVTIKVARKKGVKNPGPKDVEYDLLPARSNTPVTEAELADLGKKTPIGQIIERMQVKQKERDAGGGEASESGGIEYPTEDINPDDIPF